MNNTVHTIGCKCGWLGMAASPEAVKSMLAWHVFDQPIHEEHLHDEPTFSTLPNPIPRNAFVVTRAVVVR